MIARRTLLLSGLAAATLPTGPVRAAGALPVVATFSILADIVRQVGGGRVAVTSLVGPNADAHTFEPKPADVAAVAAARLLVVNGLGFEGWLGRLARSAGGKTRTVVASDGIKPIREDGKIDPHAFGNPLNVARYVANIRDALLAVDPDGKSDYEAATTAYMGKLDALDAEVRREIDRIPKERRRLITTHDAFGYYAERYGLEILAPEGVSTEGAVSARDVARIVTQVRKEKIPAVFLENVSDPRLMEGISRETGAKVGGELYSDALSPPDGPAATYLDLVRHNTRTITAALAP